jgi:hypothetical protein
MMLQSVSCILALVAAHFHFGDDARPWFKSAKWTAIGAIGALQAVIYLG